MREHDAWKAWRERRAELARQGVLELHLDELEDHVRCEIEAEAAADPRAIEVALVNALERLGEPNALAAEYRKAHSNMNLIPKVLGVACSLGVVTFALGGAAELSALVSAPALLLVVGFVAGGLCAGFGPRRVVRAIAVGVGSERVPTPEELERLDAVSARGQRLSWASGVIGFLAGLIATAVNLGDPAQLGPAIGLSLMSLLYGALLAELGFGSLRAWLANRTSAILEPARQTG